MVFVREVRRCILRVILLPFFPIRINYEEAFFPVVWGSNHEDVFFGVGVDWVLTSLFSVFFGFDILTSPYFTGWFFYPI